MKAQRNIIFLLLMFLGTLMGLNLAIANPASLCPLNSMTSSLVENKTRVILIQGGPGGEREVSLKTGAAMEAALKELGLDYVVADPGETEEEIRRFEKQLTQHTSKKDIALLALHGEYGEGGTVQRLCNRIGLPYTGSGAQASALCMDKIATKEALEKYEIPTPAYRTVDTKKVNLKKVEPFAELPLIVKAPHQGSSVGVYMVREIEGWVNALKGAADLERKILIEQVIPRPGHGKMAHEITVPVVNGKVFAPIEVHPNGSDFYDFKAKYSAGGSDHTVGTSFGEDHPITKSCQNIAVKTYKVLNLRGAARVDFMVEPDGTLFVIEVNTLPGCTPTSLLPESAQHGGMEFPQLIEGLLKSARTDGWWRRQVDQVNHLLRRN